MSYFKRLKRVLAGLVALTFFVTNTFTQAPVAHAMPPSRQAQTVELMSQLISENSFKIPAEFGKVTDIIPVSPSDDIRHTTYDGQLIIHIQEAHANYDAQKNIRSILQYLSQNYGIQLVLLEGAGNKLQPELFNFFPKDAELQQAVNEKLLQAGELTGAEVFLIDNDQENRDSSLGSRDSEKQGAREGIRTSPESRVPRPAPHAEAWGVENAAAYATDREAYKKVYEGRGTADRFLQDAYLEWQKQASLILPKELRDFLGRFVSYEEERLPLPNWLETLKDAALKNLKLETSKDHSVIPAQAGIQAGSPIKTFGDDKTRRSRMANEGSPLDLTDVRAQIQWPVLVRYFRLRELDGKIDAASAESEKEAFLKNIQKLEIRDPGLVKTRNQNKSLVPGTVLQDVSEIFEAAKKVSLPVYKTRFIFERLMDALPDDFSFDPYPNLRLQIQQMILMSEIQGDDLQSEIKELTAKIVEASVKKDEEKALVRALREYRLLTKLFHLELSRVEYQQIQSRGITPGKLLEGLQTRDKRQETKSEGLKSEVSSLKSLFKEALDFYQGAVEREDVMMKRVREVMAERKETKAVLITGGFHTDGFKQKAVAAGSSYIQITPNIGAITPEDQRNYLRALLGPETRDKRQQTKTGFAPVSSLQSPVFERSEIAANPVEDAPFMARVSRGLLAERLAHVLDIGRSEIRALRNDSPTALTELNTGIKNIIASAVGRSETRIELPAKPQLEKGRALSSLSDIAHYLNLLLKAAGQINDTNYFFEDWDSKEIKLIIRTTGWQPWLGHNMAKPLRAVRDWAGFIGHSQEEWTKNGKNEQEKYLERIWRGAEEFQMFYTLLLGMAELVRAGKFKEIWPEGTGVSSKKPLKRESLANWLLFKIFKEDPRSAENKELFLEIINRFGEAMSEFEQALRETKDWAQKQGFSVPIDEKVKQSLSEPARSEARIQTDHRPWTMDHGLKGRSEARSQARGLELRNSLPEVNLKIYDVNRVMTLREVHQWVKALEGIGSVSEIVSVIDQNGMVGPNGKMRVERSTYKFQPGTTSEVTFKKIPARSEMRSYRRAESGSEAATVRAETRAADKVIVSKPPVEEVSLSYDDGITVLFTLMAEGKPYKIDLYNQKPSEPLWK